MITGHKITVKDAQVEPAAQAAKHLDQHLLIVPCLISTCGLKGKTAAVKTGNILETWKNTCKGKKEFLTSSVTTVLE